jgi:hypothetical protein
MKSAGDNELWTPARLRSLLAALKGVAPAPAIYVVWRATARVGTPEFAGYELPIQPGRQDEAEFERWLNGRKLVGADRLSVSVLVIREYLDDAGQVREGILERRRGSADGPYYGNVARIEFTGAASFVRRYKALRDGRLAELPAEDDPGASLPPAEPDAEGFAGEDAAVHTWLGEGTVILDRRNPTFFEDLLGLTAIIHARRRDGTETGCGVGWHGGTAFVLTANFPRHGGNLAPPPDLEAAAEAVMTSRDLIRLETRLDDQGFRVIARERGKSSLIAVRMEGTTPLIEPYIPGRVATANDDQRRWMIYAETYEARTILDCWGAGDDGAIAVVTVDPDQEAWLHVIDTDGIETSRRSGNDAAAAVMYREQINPPAEQQATPAEARESNDPARTVPRIDAIMSDRDAPRDSLLAIVAAWSRATALLDAVADDDHSGMAGNRRDRLTALIAPLTALDAGFSLASLRRLIARTASGKLTAEGFTAGLTDLAARLRDELAMTRIVTLPFTDGEPAFGALVERCFPAAIYDIEEAARCLALRRSTAAVSHAMKVMRHGLMATERLLASPSLIDLPWARMLEALRNMALGHDDLPEALDQVRRVWRAPGLVPADRYSEEEAESVLAAVAEFMGLLAARLDANDETPAV